MAGSAVDTHPLKIAAAPVRSNARVELRLLAALYPPVCKLWSPRYLALADPKVLKMPTHLRRCCKRTKPPAWKGSSAPAPKFMRCVANAAKAWPWHQA